MGGTTEHNPSALICSCTVSLHLKWADKESPGDLDESLWSRHMAAAPLLIFIFSRVNIEVMCDTGRKHIHEYAKNSCCITRKSQREWMTCFPSSDLIELAWQNVTCERKNSEFAVQERACAFSNAGDEEKLRRNKKSRTACEKILRDCCEILKCHLLGIEFLMTLNENGAVKVFCSCASPTFYNPTETLRRYGRAVKQSFWKCTVWKSHFIVLY